MITIAEASLGDAEADEMEMICSAGADPRVRPLGANTRVRPCKKWGYKGTTVSQGKCTPSLGRPKWPYAAVVR